MTSLIYHCRSIGRLTVLGVVLGVVVCAALIAAAATAQESHYESVLRHNGLDTNTRELAEFFDQLLETPEQKRARIAPLIASLGKQQFFEREEATRRLLELRVIPIEEIRQMVGEAAGEVGWRAAAVVDRGKRKNPSLLYAAMIVIRDRKIPHLTDKLLRVIPVCRQQYNEPRHQHILRAALQALPATARSGDADRLRRVIAGDDSQLRIAATEALGAVLSMGAIKELHPLLNDRQEEVVLAAARAVANHGDRSSLDPLIRLLDAEEISVRVDAVRTLGDLTGQKFNFSAYAKPEERSEAVMKWKAWLAGPGKTAQLVFPLESLDSEGSYLNGNMLLAHGYKNRVVELDPAGKEVWSFTAKGIWSAEKMRNGNVLVAAYSENRLLEVDPQKKIVWEHRVNCLNAKPLPNGNFLVADYSGSRAVELDRDKKVVWSYKTTGNCSDVQRLENGNTLCATTSKVQEVTPEGKVVWEFAGRQMYCARRLKNGNTLICDLGTNKVVELGPDKKVVWEFSEPGVCDAFRMRNGNTLLTSSKRFVEVTPEGKVVWSKDGANYGTARK